jgi:hypothetical protein
VDNVIYIRLSHLALEVNVKLLLAWSAWLVEILLKSHENSADLFGPAQVGNGVGDGVGIFEVKQRR